MIPSSQPDNPLEIKFDDKLWCEECGQSLEQECKTHGCHSIIRDKAIPSRAKLTTPHQLTVRRLELRTANNHVYGTFAKKIIQKRTRFGPFEGGHTEQWNHQREDRLTLKLFAGGGEDSYLDCADENSCNWMIFVRPANKPEHQNMVAFQYRGQIYFVSTKAVAPEEELRIWYAKDYATQMGVDLLTSYETPSPPSPPSPFTASNLRIDEEFLKPPTKKNNRLSAEKGRKYVMATTEVAAKDEQSENLITLANIALDPPSSTSYTDLQTVQFPSVSTPVPLGILSVHQGGSPMSVPLVTTAAGITQVASGSQGTLSLPQGITSVVPTVAQVLPSLPSDNVSVNTQVPQDSQSLYTTSVPAGSVVVPQATASLNSLVPQSTTSLLQIAVSVHPTSLPTGTFLPTQGTLSVPQGTFAVPSDHTAAVYQSAAIQSAKIDDAGILTIEESAIASAPTTLNVEILTDEGGGPMINQVQLKTAMKDSWEKGDMMDSENVELTIDESDTIILTLDSEPGADHGLSDIDDAEVDEYIDTSSETCSYCGQSFPAQIYSNHDCPRQKKVGLRKRNITNRRIGKAKVDNKPKRTAKLKYGQARKRRGSLTMAVNKMTTKKSSKNGGNGEVNSLNEADIVEASSEGAIINNDNMVQRETQKYQDIRKIKGSRKRKSGVVRKKIPPPYFECDRCEMIFSSLDKLQTHFYSHTGEKPFLCPHEGCGKCFVTKFKLKRHVTTHGEGEVFSCAYCDKTFRRKDHLKNHLKVHDPNKDLYTCDICFKEYASVFAFKTHMAFHKAEQGELLCYVCSQVLPNKEELLHHLKVHSGARSVKDPDAKKHACRFCDKTFYTAKDVRRHAVVHTKQREHMCHLCPRRFGRKDHLVRHIRLAHGKDVQDSLNMEIHAIMPPVMKVTKESKKQVKKKQRNVSTKKKRNSASTENGETGESYNPPSLASLQSQPTIILPQTKLDNLNYQPETEEANTDYVLVEPKAQASFLQSQPNFTTSQQQEAPILQPIARVPNLTTQPTDQNFMELQFIIAQNSMNLPKTQQVVHQMAEQTLEQTQTIVQQTIISKSKTQRKPRKQKTKVKVSTTQGSLQEPQAIQQEATQPVSMQPSSSITLPNVQNIFENQPQLSALIGGSSFNLDNLSFSGLTSFKPKIPSKQTQVQGHIISRNSESQVSLNTNQDQLTNVSGPVFPESATAINSQQPANILEGSNMPLIFSINPSNMGMAEQLQFYQFIAPADPATNQTDQITEKSSTLVVSQQQQVNQTQPVVSGYSAPVQVTNAQFEGNFPHSLVSHDSEAVRLFFPDEQNPVL